MQPLAEHHGVTVQSASNSGRAWAGPDQIQQTLTNLIGNAITFSPVGGTVRLAATDEGSVCVFRVTDEGPGIPESMLERIFDRFNQVSVSDAREKGGTGLGLAICRGIIEQHGGRIWVDSIVGQGSTFTFSLPAVDGARPAARDPRVAEASGGASPPVTPVAIGAPASR